MHYASVISGLTLSCPLSGAAAAGTVITMENTSAGGEKPTTNSMLLESDRVKMTTDRGGMIYRGDLSKVWIVDDADKSYREINPEAMQQMRGQMSEAMQQMQQRL